jgi:hypothetical protein
MDIEQETSTKTQTKDPIVVVVRFIIPSSLKEKRDIRLHISTEDISRE